MGSWRSGGWLHGIMAWINKIDIKKMYRSPRYINVSILNQHTTKKKGCHLYLALLHISVSSTNHIWKELLWLVSMGYSIWGMASLRCCLRVFDFFLHLNSHVWPMGTGSLYCHLFVSKHVNINCHADTRGHTNMQWTTQNRQILPLQILRLACTYSPIVCF